MRVSRRLKNNIPAPKIEALLSSTTMSVFEPATVLAILRKSLSANKQKEFEKNWNEGVCILYKQSVEQHLTVHKKLAGIKSHKILAETSSDTAMS